MILYLTENNRVNLLDFLEREHAMSVKKLIGSFSLLSFIIKDMRHFSHVQYVVLDREAITESDEELIQALLSYQTIYDIRVVIVAEGLPTGSPLLLKLFQIGILNVVTATEIKEIRNELRECFSEEGMQRLTSACLPTITDEKSPDIFHEKNEQYRFTCSNLKIAIAGCDRRVGVTTTAMNLVCWINARGGTACYVEANPNNHLAHIVHLFDPEKIGDAYILDGNDFYMTKELHRDYDVIVLDCGVLGEQRLQDDFTSADLRLLCGSAMPYELARFYKAIERCTNLSIQTLGLFVPDDIKPYLFNNISNNILFGDSSHDLFNTMANTKIYKTLLETHIFEE
ncbi:hypothetical protein D3C76_56230 [compost metagenome]